MVTDPTMTSLTVNWDPAEGAVRLYKVFFVPAAGGLEEMVRLLPACLRRRDRADVRMTFYYESLLTGAGSCRLHLHHPQEPAARHTVHGVGVASLPCQGGKTPVRERKDM